MKTTIFNQFFALCITVSLFAFVACDSGPKQEDTMEAAEEHNDSAFKKPMESDAQFAAEAAAINLKEVHISQAALNRVTMDHTKQLAQMMIDEHQKAYNDLSALARTKNIAIPTNLTSGDIEDSVKITKADVKNVDKDYCDMMVSGHKDAIDKFQKQATDGSDPDLKNWASSMLPALQKHLAEAEKCQEESKKMK